MSSPWSVDTLVEKWSEEAVDFTRRKLEARGITHIPGAVEPVRVLTVRERVAEAVLGRQIVPPIARPRLMPVSAGISSEMLRKFVGSPEDTADDHGNLLLNEGIQRMLDLLIAAVSNQTAANAYGATNAYLGVGTAVTAEAATQTDLQTAAFYKAMNATFPSRATQTLSFAADFTTSEANQAWNEWSVTAGATTASGAGFTVGTTNLNRKVSSLGTKATGTWTLTVQITIS